MSIDETTPAGVIRRRELEQALKMLKETEQTPGCAIQYVTQYARKALGLRRDQLACILFCKSDDVKAWEEGRRVVPTKCLTELVYRLETALVVLEEER